MTDYPIIFNAEMVSALIFGTKTQTRQILKWQNSSFNGRAWNKKIKSLDWGWRDAWVDLGPSPAGNSGPYLKLPYKWTDPDWADTVHRVYPKVQIGDRLWVREQCAVWSGLTQDVVYRADNDDDWENIKHDAKFDAPWRFKNSIHMPRWASRLTLTVTDVRIQRLQDINKADAMAEGVSYAPYLDCFKSLWKDIKGNNSWAENPWVIATSFTTEERNIDDD